MPVIENISPLHFDHKLGFYGDYENIDVILKLTEVKEPAGSQFISTLNVVAYKQEPSSTKARVS